jgi:Uma2 family endonuclease
MIGKIAPERTTEQRIPMRYDEFQTRIPEDTRAEWTNGEAILLMPPTIRHQDIVAFLLILLRLFVDMKRLGKALGAPCEMRLVAQDSAREPDILFVARANLARLTAQRLVGPADLVVEVVSDESAMRDRVEKWQEYQAAGIHEYWLVDPRPGKPIVEVWGLDDTGQYQPIAPSAGGILASRVLPGFWLDRTWLEAEELPNPLTCFAQIAGPDALRQAFG